MTKKSPETRISSDSFSFQIQTEDEEEIRIVINFFPWFIDRNSPQKPNSLEVYPIPRIPTLKRRLLMGLVVWTLQSVTLRMLHNMLNRLGRRLMSKRFFQLTSTNREEKRQNRNCYHSPSVAVSIQHLDSSSKETICFTFLIPLFLS